METLLEMPIIQLLLVVLAVYAFLKFATLCKQFSLTPRFKKGIYVVTGLAVLILNWFAKGELQLWMIIIGLAVVLAFTIALMSGTKAEV